MKLLWRKNEAEEKSFWYSREINRER
jgi:hypothetical protein